MALRAAAGIAADFRVRLHVVHLIEVDDYPHDPDTADWPARVARALREQRRRVERTVRSTGVVWAYEERRGEPAAELVRAAAEQQAVMIVVGTRGQGLRHTLSRTVRPSVSHGVIARSDRPVLVVPPSISWGDGRSP